MNAALVPLLFCQLTLSSRPLEYHGSFALVDVTGGAPCDKVFNGRNHLARFVQTGSTGTDFLLSWYQANGSFFNGVSVTGLVGPDCDFGGNKYFTLSGWQYEMKVEGVVHREQIFATVTTTATGPNGAVCAARGEYTGFR